MSLCFVCQLKNDLLYKFQDGGRKENWLLANTKSGSLQNILFSVESSSRLQKGYRYSNASAFMIQEDTFVFNCKFVINTRTNRTAMYVKTVNSGFGSDIKALNIQGLYFVEPTLLLNYDVIFTQFSQHPNPVLNYVHPR